MLATRAAHASTGGGRFYAIGRLHGTAAVHSAVDSFMALSSHDS